MVAVVLVVGVMVVVVVVLGVLVVLVAVGFWLLIWLGPIQPPYPACGASWIA